MHDAAIEAGLVARPERVVTDDEFNLAYREELAAQVERMKADRSVAELEQLEEDGEDDDAIIAQLRQKRIDEIKQARTIKQQQGREVGQMQTDSALGACASASLPCSHCPFFSLSLALCSFPRSIPSISPLR